MTRPARWTLWALLGLAAVAAALGLAFAWLVPNDEELAARIAAQAKAKLGVEVKLGAVHWGLFPPALVIEDASTVQPQPISFKRLEMQLQLRDLLQRRAKFDQVVIEGAVMPQMSLRGLRVAPAVPEPDASEPMVGKLRFTNLTWITRHGTPLEFDGTVLFDTEWRPREADIMRAGSESAAKLTLQREGDADTWQVRLLLGGGTAHGQVRLKEGKDGALVLSGELEPKNVEVASAMTAFKRNTVVRGKASGRTVLSASGKGVAELARSLHTKTNFSMSPATLLRFDIDKAIRSFGKDRAGETPLQSLTGQMDTQNTPNGIVVTYSDIQAKGETFSAKGQATIADRRINGEMTVDLAGGLIGVPLKVAGPLSAPQVTVPTSAVAGATAGAVIGTVLLPGVGTAIGASVGASIGKLFGGDTKAPTKP